MYTCCVHTSVLTSTILAVLFVSPSKIALEKFYVYCHPPPPLLLDENYALEALCTAYSALKVFDGIDHSNVALVPF